MHVSVNFQDERLDFELPDECVVATWSAPVGLEPPQAIEALRDALETPWEFPPLRQMIVPGDRVVIAMDSSIAHPGPISRSARADSAGRWCRARRSYGASAHG